MAVGTITSTVVTLPGSTKRYKKISYTNTANGAGAFATATITDAYGYIAKVVLSEGATGLDAVFALACVETGKSAGDHFFGSVTGVDFSSGNTSFIAIPGQTASSVSLPIPVMLTGSYDISTTTAQTIASAIYTVDIYLVDSL